MKRCKNNTKNSLARKTSTVIICVMALFLSSFSNTGLNGFIAGIFDNGRLITAKHDSLKIVTGIINSREDGVSCRLYIYNNFSDINKGLIKIYNPVDNQIYEGKLIVDKRGLIVRAKDVIFPCQRIMDLTGGESFLLTKSVAKDIYLGIVKVPKAFLYDTPEKITARKSFLIKGDIVSIKQRIGTWMKVAYLDNPSVVKWIKCQDLKFGE